MAAMVKNGILATPAFMELLNEIAHLGTISPKFWDAERPDYNPIFANVINPLISLIPGVDDLGWPFICGMINALIDELASIPEMVGFITSFLIDENFRKETINAFRNFSWSAIWDGLKESHQGNRYQVAHQVGKDVGLIGITYFSLGGAGAISKALKGIRAAAQSMARLSKAGLQLLQRIQKDLGNILVATYENGQYLVKNLLKQEEVVMALADGGLIRVTATRWNPDAVGEVIQRMRQVNIEGRGIKDVELVRDGNKIDVREIKDLVGSLQAAVKTRFPALASEMQDALADFLARKNLLIEDLTDPFGKLLAEATEGGTAVLARLDDWPATQCKAFFKDLQAFSPTDLQKLIDNPGLVNAWKNAPDGLKTNVDYLKKVSDYTVEKFDTYIKDVPTRNPAGSPDAPFRQYQERVAGLKEYELQGNNSKIWADGVNRDAGKVLEAKFVSDPSSSPFIEGSSAPQFIRDKISDDVRGEFQRYADILKDPNSPLTQLEIVTNHADAVKFFEDILKDFNDLPVTIIVKP